MNPKPPDISACFLGVRVNRVGPDAAAVFHLSNLIVCAQYPPSGKSQIYFMSITRS